MGNACSPPHLQENLDSAISDEKFDFVPQENYIKDIKDFFEIGKTLGSGVSCSVYVGKMKSSGIKYAVKEMVRDDEFNPRSFRQEVDFLRTLHEDEPHANILKYHDAYITPKYFYIVTELCEGGALFGMFSIYIISTDCNYIFKTNQFCRYCKYVISIYFSFLYILMLN